MGWAFGVDGVLDGAEQRLRHEPDVAQTDHHRDHGDDAGLFGEGHDVAEPDRGEQGQVQSSASVLPSSSSKLAGSRCAMSRYPSRRAAETATRRRWSRTRNCGVSDQNDRPSRSARPRGVFARPSPSTALTATRGCRSSRSDRAAPPSRCRLLTVGDRIGATAGYPGSPRRDRPRADEQDSCRWVPHVMGEGRCCAPVVGGRRFGGSHLDHRGIRRRRR